MHRAFMAAGLALACLTLPYSNGARSQDAYSAAFGACHGHTCVVRFNPARSSMPPMRFVAEQSGSW